MIAYLRRVVIRIVTPFSKIVGKIYMAPHAREISFEDYADIIDVIMPGDVLLSYSKGEMTNYLIPGQYKHCAMFVGRTRIVEAVGGGVHTELLSKFLSSKDRIAILRPRFCDQFQATDAAAAALNAIGKPYDFSFEPNEKAFYCAELILYCYNRVLGNRCDFVRRDIFGVQTVLPQDYKDAKDKFGVVAEYPAGVSR